MRKMYNNRLERFPLPEFEKPDAKVVVSLTSYKHRIKSIIPTLKSLNSQSYKPDKIVLYIAYEDKEYVFPEINRYCEVRYCEDTLSYKKFNGFWDFPDCYVATADDDLIYDEEWLKTLLQASQLSPTCVAAHNTFLLEHNSGEYNYGGLVTRAVNRISLEGRVKIYVMTGAGVLIQPGTAEKITELKDAWKYCKYCDEKALTILLAEKNIPVVATSMHSEPHHKEAYKDEKSLWNMYNCKNQKQRWNECKEFIKIVH